MPVNGTTTDPRLLALYASEATPDAPQSWFDAHTHMGHNDPDGRSATAEEIVGALDDAGVERALIFAMHEPAGYPGPNDAVLEACAASGGRLLPLSRIDPAREPLAEARRCLAAGTKGFKFHPRSDAFPMPHPGVEEIIALADELRLPVLFHAGRGIPHLGEAVTDYARRYPGARLILAHAGISDLGDLDRAAAELPNLYFDTSWWLVADQLQLHATIPPGQILYASDAPYGAPRFATFMSARASRAVGLSPEARRSIAGAQLARLVDGEEPLDLGPPPGEGSLGPRSVRVERVMTYGGVGLMGAVRGLPPVEALQLAISACLSTRDDEEAALLRVVAGLLRIAVEAVEADPESPLAAAPATVAALTVAGTLSAGVPEIDL